MTEKPKQEDNVSRYILPRDYTETNRLNLQHYLWVRLLGYLLHPSIPTNTTDLKIADVGSGTGAWLDDLAVTLAPTVSLESLDISFDAHGPRKALPENITFRHFDVTATEVPMDMVDAYDIVHIRAFAFVLVQNQIPTVARNLCRLLKPGGYIQWSDIDVASFRIETLNDGLETPTMIALMKLSKGQDTRLDPQWVPLLPQYLRDTGFNEIVADIKDPPPYLAMAKHKCNLVMHEMIASSTGNMDVANSIQRLLPEVAKETDCGAYYAFTRYTVVGRKSSF